ncbi:hypothetical protein BGZ60DRAFT_551817 [Tricladium varicosporioides]|nr:hypothetical protein BGZ60DRAFT_551817 [Hymenoscyphus varicosporioides]
MVMYAKSFTGIRIIALIALLHFPVCLGITEYVNDNPTVMVQSTQPCTLHGDSDLYGLGVRISFYLQFGVGLVGVWVGSTKEIKSLRLGFNTLSSALLIVLFRNANRGSFALLEWNIVGSLIFLLPFVMMPLPLGFGEITTKTEGQSQGRGAGGAEHKAVRIPVTNLTAREPTEPNGDISQQANIFETIPLNPAVNAAAEPLLQLDRGSNGRKRLKDTSTSLNVKKLQDNFYVPSETSFPGWSHERYRPYLADPVGIGYLMFLFAIFMLSQPWLQFTQRNVGHKLDCSIRIFLFAPINPYNTYWSRLYKALSIISIPLTVYCLYWAIRFVFDGVVFWRAYEEVLNVLDDKRDGVGRLMEFVSTRMKALADGSDSSSLSSIGDVEGPHYLPSDVQESFAKAQKDLSLIDGNIASQIQTKEDAEAILARATQVRESYYQQKKKQKIIQRIACIMLAFFGGATIASIELTIYLNHIILADSISTSTGQSLSLLVAVFSSVAFLFEYYKKSRKERTEFKKIEKYYYESVSAFDAYLLHLLSAIIDLRSQQDRVRNKLQKQKERLERKGLSRRSSRNSNRTTPVSGPKSWISAWSPWGPKPKLDQINEREALNSVITE